VRLRGPRGRGVELELPLPIDIFSRERLDGALLERALGAGASLEPVRVSRVELESGGARLSFGSEQYSFDFAIGADGASSLVRRALLGSRPGGPGGYATAGYYVEGLPEEGIYIEFLPDMKGYLWAFPRPDHSSVGIAAPIGRLNGRQLQQRVRDFLERVYPDSRDLPRIPFAASIPSPTHRQARRERLAGDRVALIGDAANQVDAITGEGIHHALDAAAMLAEILDREGPERAPAAYEKAWRRGPGRELVVAAAWTRRYYRAGLVEWFVDACARRRGARRIMADLMALQQPYSSLLVRTLRDYLRSLAH
jgi:flavin-dependent dehydrogenase